MRSLLAVILATLVLATTPDTGRAGEGGLTALLGLLPESPRTYESAPIFAYVDLRAVERAAGVRAPASEAALAAMPKAERAAWVDAYGRVVTGPEALQNFGQVMRRGKVTVRDALGFDWFAVDRVMGFWDPPHTVTVLAGEPSLTTDADFEGALTRRGFADQATGSGTVWHRLDDDATALGLKDEYAAGDVLLGRVPRAERIAVLPGLLVATRNWPDMNAVLAVEGGEGTTAAGAVLMRTMIEALSAGSAVEVVQALAFTLPEVGGATRAADVLHNLFGSSRAIDIDALNRKLAARGPELPPYPLALFLDLQAGSDQIALIALPYGDHAAAEAAANVVAGRLRDWKAKGATEPLLATAGGALEARIVDDPRLAAAVAATFVAIAAGGNDDAETAAARKAAADRAGGAVALIGVRRPTPEAGTRDRPGLVLARWLDGIYRRDFAVLAVP